MRVTVIGDIGWRYLYHLGDEAMTEAAIDMLRARGIDDIILVAGEPEVSEAFYGLPCVPRVGFKSGWNRARNSTHLDGVTETLQKGTFAEGSIYAAIRDSDALLIAGGGNMNSNHYHLLYERLAATRIAEFFGKPLFVTSQTVGPQLRPMDREKAAEIAQYATCFGARELTTFELLRTLTDHPETVHHTMDDAMLLRSNDESRAAVEELDTGDRYIVASFTNHQGTVWNDADTYYRDIAALCDALAVRHDANVLLAPHAGSLDPERTTRDQESNATIAGHSTSGRVRELRQVTAREDVSLIEGALLSLSTRYHPTVFGPAAATPTGSIAPSYYSSIRMRGSMRNIGLERFVVPTVAMHLAEDAFSELITDAASVRAHMEKSRAIAADYQNRWWDSIVDAIKTGTWTSPGSLPQIETYVPKGEWSRENESLTSVSDLYTSVIEQKRWANEDLASARAQAKKLRAALTKEREENAQLRNDYERVSKGLAARVSRRLRSK